MLLHDTAQFLADNTDTAATAVRTAIIGGLALVLAAVIPALLSRREREPKSIRDLRAVERRLRDELASDRDEWKHTAEQAIRGTAIRDAEIDRLRKLCVDNGLNPYIPKAPPPEAGP